jgi:hypothetical protein
MLHDNAAVAIFADPGQAQNVIAELARSGFDLKRLSVAGKAYREQNELVAYYRQGDQMKCWGERSGFWNRLCSMIRGWALFSSPGTGLLLVVGPLALWIVLALENSPIFGGLSAFGAMLYSMGLAKDSVQDYEEALRKGNYLVIVHGPAKEVMRAKRIIKSVEAASSSG